MTAYRTEVRIYADSQRVPDVLHALPLPFAVAPYHLPISDIPGADDISVLAYIGEWTDEHQRAAVRLGDAGVLRSIARQTSAAPERDG